MDDFTDTDVAEAAQWTLEQLEEWNATMTTPSYIIARDGHEWLVIAKHADIWLVRARFADRADAEDYLERVQGVPF